VEQVSITDIKAFIVKLCEKERMDPCRYRLPTEAQWEYSARGGTRTKFYWGNTLNGDYLWYLMNSSQKTHPVGRKLPNEYGLYDMSGNVLEWTQDWFDSNYYSNSPKNNPIGPISGFYETNSIRGGSAFGMNWDNHGSCWEIDHIIPIAHFDLTNAEEQQKAFHFTNLQPLYWKENRIKSDRIVI
jgi:formylglycine-generating enzyme required for sulfatase activity